MSKSLSPVRSIIASILLAASVALLPSLASATNVAVVATGPYGPQTAAGFNSPCSTSASLAFSGVTAGEEAVVFAGVPSNSAVLGTPTDSEGNTYTLAMRWAPQVAIAREVFVWYARLSVNATTLSINIPCGTDTTDIYFASELFTGVRASNPVDHVGHNYNYSQFANETWGTTTQGADELMVSYVYAIDTDHPTQPFTLFRNNGTYGAPGEQQLTSQPDITAKNETQYIGSNGCTTSSCVDYPLGATPFNANVAEVAGCTQPWPNCNVSVRWINVLIGLYHS